MMTKPLVGHGFHHFLPSFKSNLCDSGLRRSLCAQSWGSRWSHHTVMGSEMIRPYWVTYELSMFQWPWAKHGQAIFLPHFWTRPCLQAVQGFNFWAWGLCGHFWTLPCGGLHSALAREGKALGSHGVGNLSWARLLKETTSLQGTNHWCSLSYQALLMANFPMVSLKISAVFEGQWKAIESTHTVNPGPLWPPWLNRSPSRSQTSKMEMASNLPRGFKLFLTWGSWSSSSSCIIQFHELQAVTAKVSRWKGKWNLGSSRYISLGSYAVVLVRSRLGSLYRLWCTRSHLRESSQWTPSRLCSRDFWTVSLATRQRWT